MTFWIAMATPGWRGTWPNFSVAETGLQFAGFDGGAIGNHAQVFLGDGSLLLDPTIGLVAKVGYDEILDGKPVDEGQVLIFRQHNDGILESFEVKVWQAIVNGSYRPSDVIYHFNSLDDYL